MSCYLDVRATRIQHWLARTSALAHRKGASSLLVQTTGKAAVEGRLPPGVSWNPDAGDVDGVISLVFAAGAGESPAQAAQRISRAVVGHLQAELPTLGFEATWTEASDYGTAYGQLAVKQATGDFAYDAPPLNTELVLAMRCPECAASPGQPASTRGDDEREADESVAPCPECQRKRAMQRRTGRTRPRTEQTLVDSFSDRAWVPTEFETLARSQDGGTRLALIFADGNRVGAFIAGAAAAHAGSKTELARALQTATTTALVAAVDDGTGAMLPAIPHLVGGDDILITVRACDGWRVTGRFMRTFDAKLADLRQPSWPAELPTVSAGLLFHHFAEPFPYALSRCEKLLEQAKHAQQGTTATIGFADLTFDGEDVSGAGSGGTTPVTLGWLAEREKLLDALADSLSEAQRHSLLDLARSRPGPDGRLRPSDDLGRKIIEQGNRALAQLLYKDGVRGIQGRPLEEHDAAVVRNILSIMRWWR